MSDDYDPQQDSIGSTEVAWEAMRERLRKVIERQDAERGRPLTARERLANLRKAIYEDRR
jgi:hypothetical protein